MKHNNIRIIGIPEGEEKEQGIETLFEKIMMENFTNLEEGQTMQVQEAQRVPIKMKPNRRTLRHITIKMPSFKDKERILKATREKQEAKYIGAPIRLVADFSIETLQSMREWQEIVQEWQEIVQVMKNKGLQPRLLYSARLSIKMEGEIRSFPHKRRLNEHTSTKPALQDLPNGLLYEEKEKSERGWNIDTKGEK